MVGHHNISFGKISKIADCQYTGVARGPKKVMLGSIVEIAGLNTWTDEQIVDLAFIAHDAMQTAHEDFARRLRQDGNPDRLSKKQPTVVTVLQVDNTAYISTSIVGGAYLYLPAETPNRHEWLDRSRYLKPADTAHPCNTGLIAASDALVA